MSRMEVVLENLLRLNSPVLCVRDTLPVMLHRDFFLHPALMLPHTDQFMLNSEQTYSHLDIG